MTGAGPKSQPRPRNWAISAFSAAAIPTSTIQERPPADSPGEAKEEGSLGLDQLVEIKRSLASRLEVSPFSPAIWLSKRGQRFGLNKACLVGFATTYAPHLEGWRDWPDEAPATTSSQRFEGRCQVQQVGDLEDVGKVRSDLCPTQAEVFLLAITAKRKIGCH